MLGAVRLVDIGANIWCNYDLVEGTHYSIVFTCGVIGHVDVIGVVR